MASGSSADLDDEPLESSIMYNMFDYLLDLRDKQPDVAQHLEEKWYNIIGIWYPHLTKQVYCVPPYHFYRQSYGQALHPKVKRPGLPEVDIHKYGMSKLKWSVFSAIKDDEAQQRVMQALFSFAERKRMVAFIMSNVVFANYMSKGYTFTDSVPDYPKPDIATGDEGEIDILMIDKQNSKIFVLEIKSTGDKDDVRSISEEKKIEELAVKFKTNLKKKTKPRLSDQLINNKRVVTKLLTTPRLGSHNVSVVGVSVLPNVSRDILMKTLKQMETSQNSQDQKDLHDLMGAIGVSTVQEILDVTLCAEDLPPQNFGCADFLDDETFRRMENVFTTLLKIGGNISSKMSDDLYSHIVALFCGPLTTVGIYTEKSTPRVRVVGKKVIPEECRTEYGAARKIAERFSWLVLNEDQINVIHIGEEFVHLEGPPGTGKTLVLLLKILIWLDAGHVVVIFSISPPSRSITHQLKRQAERLVQKTHKPNDAQEILKKRLLYFVQTRAQANVDTKKLEERFSKYQKKTKQGHGKVCFVLDESGFDGNGLESFFSQVEELYKTDKFKNSLIVWSASVEKAGRPTYVNGPGENDPQKLGTCYQLKMPLRCPPTVQRFLMLVQPCLDLDNVCGFREEYTVANPAVHMERAAVKNPTVEGPTGPQNQYPAEGCPVFLIAHGSHEKAAKAVWNCGQCGDELAEYLKSTLCIGEKECCCKGKDISYSGGKCQDCKKWAKGSLADTPLECSDVMIVATRKALDQNPCQGAMVDAMDKKNLKVARMTAREEGAAPNVSEDTILCADMVSVQGLERAVIVIVPDAKPSSTSEVRPDQRTPSEEGQPAAGDSSDIKSQYMAALDSLSSQCRKDVFYIGSRTVCQLILIHHSKGAQTEEPMETE